MRWLGTTLLILLTFLIGVPALADQNGSASFGLEHVETGLTHIDLTLEPGESEELTLRHFVRDDAGVDVTVFPSNVYTVRGGGMGVNDIDQARTGATTWLDLQTTDFNLTPDEPIEQSITITVPEDADPGEYITAIVSAKADTEVGSDRPRQVVPVYIEVPGERNPDMELESVQHHVAEGQSVVALTLANSGNVHLRPEGSFAIRSLSGTTLADTAIGLDTVYARTSTRIEITFTEELPAGEYLIAIDLRDDITGASAAADDLSVIVGGGEPASEETPEPTEAAEPDDDPENGGIVGGIRLPELPSGGTPGMEGLILGGLGLFSIMVLVATLIVLRSQRAPETVRESMPVDDRRPTMFEPQKSQEPPARSSHRPRPIRQLIPPGRTQ
ncbi:MAG: hypothetical protein EA415_16195 [Sphaerobacteraceae bacterium]|nr:MAG: hypothetical protein EA415_16195 [Sphaerobacteraceae bacterium]